LFKASETQSASPSHSSETYRCGIPHRFKQSLVIQWRIQGRIRGMPVPPRRGVFFSINKRLQSSDRILFYDININEKYCLTLGKHGNQFSAGASARTLLGDLKTLLQTT